MNNLEKEFVPYPESLALKELGFDEECFMSYWNGTNELKDKQFFNMSPREVKAPTFSQAFRWFRENYNLNSYLRCDCSANEVFGYIWTIHKIMGVGEENFIRGYETSYEESELNCLRKLIELCKKK